MNFSKLNRFIGRLVSSQIFRDYTATYLLNFALTVAILLSFRIASLRFSELSFAHYALLRRFLSLLLPLLCLGVGVALTRFVAVAHENVKEKRRCEARYLLGAIMLLLLTLIPVLLLGVSLPAVLAAVLWGDGSKAFLIQMALPAIVGSLLHAVSYAYLRGKFLIIRAGILNLTNLGLVPIAALCLSDSVEKAVFWSGWWVLSISTTALLPAIVQLRNTRVAEVLEASRDLLRWGMPRVPGDLLLALMLHLPILHASHFLGITEAGYVAYSLSLVTLLQAIVSPASVLLLPETAMLLERGAFKELRIRTTRALTGGTVATICAVCVIVFFTEKLVTFHLGTASEDLIRNARLACFLAIPFNVYICLRSVLDGATRRPINTANLALTFLVYLLVIAIERGLFCSNVGPIVSLFFALLFLAGLTIFQTRRALQRFADHSAALKYSLGERHSRRLPQISTPRVAIECSRSSQP